MQAAPREISMYSQCLLNHYSVKMRVLLRNLFLYACCTTFMTLTALSVTTPMPEFPNFLSGLNRDQTLRFYNLEANLNMSKAQLRAERIAWASTLPETNKRLYEKYASTANATRNHLANLAETKQANASTAAKALFKAVLAITSNASLSRSEEAARLDSLMSTAPAGIVAELDSLI